MTAHAHNLALLAIEDHADTARAARCEMGRALDRTDPDDVKARSRIQRDYGKAIAVAIRNRNTAREDAVKLYRELEEKVERLDAQIERLRKGRVA